MEVATADRTKSGREEERWALQGHAQVNPALGTPCLGPCGPRDMISKLSLDIGDNRVHHHVNRNKDDVMASSEQQS